MAVKVALFLLASFLLLSTRVSSDVSEENLNEMAYGAVGAAPPVAVAPAPAPHKIIYTNDCIGACDERCSLHSRKNVCKRACNTCCSVCKCVPAGTYGNRETCGRCYTDWTTHGNMTKCP
ncbi:Gibberellin-regulated family protein [Rhynchospora pubera]|uniref:Gibberellin-regulated family protein n=1 Tax=Rhynchospora pubera TaxID=906938 RepID=A0AAV8G8D0_9POAL|nr:Gibberellin-regulated family protein [Rhynchospora pubera]